MDKIFGKIKKQNGEGFAKVLRDYHNGIFEIPDIVDVVKHAGNTKSDAEQIVKYLADKLLDDDKDQGPIGDPLKLLDKAGYDAYYADTLEKQNAISKYFQENERLCTFNDSSRFKNYYIINAVKKNVDSINRQDFVGKEQREDLYGTSVISIQVSKQGGFISIKNRYNHTVTGCDNTFKSNPDNIIKGLSAAIQKKFCVSFSTKQKLLPDNVIVVGEQLFKHHYEINGIFIGNKAYIKNGTLFEVLPEKGEFLFDYFIFNAGAKTFRLVDDSIQDSFHEDFNKVYGGKSTLFVKKDCLYDGDTLLISTEV